MLASPFKLAVLGIAVLFCTDVCAHDDGPRENDLCEVCEADTTLPMGPLILGSMGAVVVVVGAGFGWQAYEENEDFNTAGTGDQAGTYPLATDALADDIETHALVANILMFSGSAMILGGILWWLLDDDGDERRKQTATAHWRPRVGPRGAGIAVSF
ncbi:MAG: hypothetical protein QNJ97_01430 [Myxococcota bacterium]|nr:hypothetical protein [Myxococcota bacterium]